MLMIKKIFEYGITIAGIVCTYAQRTTDGQQPDIEQCSTMDLEPTSHT